MEIVKETPNLKEKYALDSNVYIFLFQKNQNIFKGTFDQDRLKANLSEKIIIYIKNLPITDKHINQKIVSEIKQVCEKKLFLREKLFFDENYLKELFSDYPGTKYTQKDTDVIQIWQNNIANPDQKFNFADMIIYVVCQKSGVTVIITDDIGDFNYCQIIYNQHYPNSKQIKIWSLQEAIINLKINNN